MDPPVFHGLDHKTNIEKLVSSPSSKDNVQVSIIEVGCLIDETKLHLVCNRSGSDEKKP